MIFIVTDESGSESDNDGAPMCLDESTLLKEFRQARERMAEQAHPHESRAKSVLDIMRGVDAAEQARRSVSGYGKRKEDHEAETRAFKRIRFNEGDRGNGTTVNIRREAYEHKESDSNTPAKSEACPYGCDYSSIDVELVKAHLSKCPNRNSSNSGGTGEITSSSQNKFAKNLVQSFQRNVKAGLDDNLNLLCNVSFRPNGFVKDFISSNI